MIRYNKFKMQLIKFFNDIFDVRYLKLVIMLVILITALPKLVNTETLTITTYYPAPYGGYVSLLTTNNTWLARDAGNVGIGTANPQTKLDVAGTAQLRGAPGKVGLYVDPNGYVGIGTTKTLRPLSVMGYGYQLHTAVFGDTDSNVYLGIGTVSRPRVGLLRRASIQAMYKPTGDNPNDASNVPADLVINADGGNVGIGTGEYFPQGKLHVDWGNLIVTRGKVGIGTTNPNADLHVKGNLKVENGVITGNFGRTNCYWRYGVCSSGYYVAGINVQNASCSCDEGGSCSCNVSVAVYCCQ
jgi:hypothetical protein